MTTSSPTPQDEALFYLADGRYAVEARLGGGAGGEVFAGRDTLLERPVAIKRLPPDAVAASSRPRAVTAGSTPEPRPPTDLDEASARLLTEARALARLSHPHVVTVHDAFQEQDCLHLVLERVPGPTLRQRLDEGGPLPLDELRRLARQLAAALDHAHAHGIVHRDLKPENVLLAPGGVAKLVDFGIARISGTARMTSPAEAVGTPAYVAPEQATGSLVDGRADLYALGCVLYEAATGTPPFEAETPLLVISQHLYATPQPPSVRRPDFPPSWDALILRLLCKRPEDRPPSAAALLQEIDALERIETGAVAPAPTGVSPLETPAGESRRDGEPVILAIDDDRDLAEVIEFVLRRAGFEARTAYDGIEGWAQFLEFRPDLVVLDINMPGLDGFEVLARIRALPGSEAATPVIMLTARNDETSIVAALEGGANDYIAKPFSPRQLVARIRAALRQARRTPEVA